MLPLEYMAQSDDRIAKDMIADGEDKEAPLYRASAAPRGRKPRRPTAGNRMAAAQRPGLPVQYGQETTEHRAADRRACR